VAVVAFVTDLISFGTDGWRGVIAEDFTFDNLRRVSAAAADFFRDNLGAGNGTVLVGYDRRFLSERFATEAACILQSRGLPVELSRCPLPTPALSVCIKNRKASWGVMITASHNPACYSGFKVKDGNGRSALPEITRQIEQRLPAEVNRVSKPDQTPRLSRFSYSGTYDAYLRRRLDWSLLRRFRARVVFDHLYGVAAGIPERLLRGSAIKIVSLHAERDPLFGGLHPEPIDENLGLLKQTVRRQKALLGIALDGDADRLGVVDNHGQYLTPHQVFPLLTLYCIDMKGWRGKIVQSVSLGALGPRIAQAYGLPFEEVPVGFKHIAERMLKEDILTGGEESGGYAFRGGLPERDGVLSGLLFLEMLAATRKTPVQLLQEMEKRFGAARFRRRDIPLKQPILDKEGFARQIQNQLPAKILQSTVEEVRTLDGIKIVLKDGSWILLRPSGTEPLLRTYAESDAWSKTDRLLALARQWVEVVE
jgi:phosphomannomutase